MTLFVGLAVAHPDVTESETITVFLFVGEFAVDEVVPQPDKNKLAAWEKYHFDKMFVGSDWQGTPQWNEFEKQFAPYGVQWKISSLKDQRKAHNNS